MPPKKKAVAKAAEALRASRSLYAEGDLVRSLDMVKLYPAKVLKVGATTVLHPLPGLE